MPNLRLGLLMEEMFLANIHITTSIDQMPVEQLGYNIYRMATSPANIEGVSEVDIHSIPNPSERVIMGEFERIMFSGEKFDVGGLKGVLITNFEKRYNANEFHFVLKMDFRVDFIEDIQNMGTPLKFKGFPVKTEKEEKKDFFDKDLFYI